MLIRGEIIESVTGKSRWMNTDKGIFIRFVQFVYIGDYSISKGSIVQVVIKAESLL